LERLSYAGGNWNNGGDAGVFYLNGNNPRSNANTNVGFRSAFLQVCQKTRAYWARAQRRRMKGVCFPCRTDNPAQTGAALAVLCREGYPAGMSRAAWWQEMKKITGLFDEVTSFSTLYAAYLRARAKKRYREEVLIFSANLEKELFQLQRELRDGTYRVGSYREFYVNVPKRRLIMALRFRDRVVQWAIYIALNPHLERRFIFDSYGCRVGKGSLAAAVRLQYWMRQVDRKPLAPGQRWYYLKLDISKYFYRVDHSIIMDMIGSMVDDQRFIGLMDVIVNGDTPFGLPNGASLDECPRESRLYDVGMPIGNLSSQMIANAYLDILDQFCKHTLHIHHYIRYMDDIIILHDNLQEIHQMKDSIEAFIGDRLHLQLNKKTAIRPIGHGVEFVGWRIYTTHAKLRKSTIRHLKRSLKKLEQMYANYEIELDKCLQTVGSYFGLLSHGDNYRMREWISNNITFSRSSSKEEVVHE
jgi:retron-type reverse transcriptase